MHLKSKQTISDVLESTAIVKLCKVRVDLSLSLAIKNKKPLKLRQIKNQLQQLLDFRKNPLSVKY